MEYKNMPLGADHLLTDRAYAYYVTEVISAWANRYNEETA